MLRFIALFSVVLFICCESQNLEQESRSFEALSIDDQYEETLPSALTSNFIDGKIQEAISNQICPYIYINIVTNNPNLLEQSMCICSFSNIDGCYSTGNLGSPFDHIIAIPIEVNEGCPGATDESTFAIGLGDEQPFGNDDTTIQLLVQVSQAANATSIISYFPETSTFVFNSVGTGISFTVNTEFWFC